MLLKEKLKQFFGYSSFREGQEEVVQKILNEKNLCVVMPTGAGKSLCYQLPTLLSDGYSIVISPLISLMKDQVDSLNQIGLSAVELHSNLTPKQQEDNLLSVYEQKAKFLYLAPERLKKNNIKQLLLNNPPEYIFIDEAHCISQWGHDFRPDYRRIGEIIKQFPIRSVCAFTATATPKVQTDIVRYLYQEEMEIIISGFARPNLKFSVFDCKDDREKIKEVKKILEKKEPTLIYCSSRKAVDDLAEGLRLNKYHAGMTAQERTDAQNYFTNDACPMMVATNAFGMGIDRYDLRNVLHFNIPGSLEAYYQEAGRAGRDGKKAECLLFFSRKDRFIQEFFIEQNNPSEKLIRFVWKFLRKKSREIGVLENNLVDLRRELNHSQLRTDFQLSAILKVLDLHSYISRGFRRENRGFFILNSKQEIDYLKMKYKTEKTQYDIFMYKLLVKYGEELLDGVEMSYIELERLTGLNKEQVYRQILKGNREEFIWTAPFSGRPITILRDDEDLEDIDFQVIIEKENFEKQRLQEVIDYRSTRKCRQQFLICYFGQNFPDWTCGICDLCEKHSSGEIHSLPSVENDAYALKQILVAMEKHSRHIGREKLVLLLLGSQDKKIKNLSWSPAYAVLSHYEKKRLEAYVDELVQLKYIKIEYKKIPAIKRKIPLLFITDEGKNKLEEI